MNKELREKHQIPKRKVLPDLLPITNPKWYRELRAKNWWNKAFLREIDTTGLSESLFNKIEIYNKLNEIMIEIGGSETCIPGWDEDFIKLLERGYYRKGKSKRIKEYSSDCHSNVVRIYNERAEEDDIIICTGFALSKDFIWRKHPWILQKYMTRSGLKTRILETTEKKVAYFGFELTSEEISEFAERNH